MLRRLPLLLTLAAVFPTQAQLLRGYGVKVGPVAGDVRSPGLDGESSIPLETERRIGLAAFAYAEWLDLPRVSVVTEAGYVQRGFAFEQANSDEEGNPAGTIRFGTRLDYLAFATQLKLRLPEGLLVPYLVGGPHLSLFLGGDPDGEGALASSYAPTAFGGAVGVGAEASRLLPFAVFGELRYGFDVTNSLPDVPRDAYNNAFELLVGVRL